jgi:hypothetical protein
METFKRKNITVECDYAKKGESFTSIVVKMKTFDSGTIIAEKRLVLMGKRDWNRYINSMISHKLRLIEEEKYEEIENINRMIDKEIRDFKEYYDE